MDKIFLLECFGCKKDIPEFSQAFHKMDERGFTLVYCRECWEKLNKKESGETPPPQGP
jgi:hypothetical protein